MEILEMSSFRLARRIVQARRAAASVMGIPLGLAGSLVPKSKRKIVAGAWHGEQFSDNPKYFVIELTRDRPDFQVTWIARSTESIRQARHAGVRALHVYDPRAWWACSRAEFWFYSHSTADIFPGLFKRNSRTNLTHGTPLKRIWDASPTTAYGKGFATVSRWWRGVQPRDQTVVAASMVGVDRLRASLQPSTQVRIEAGGFARWLPMIRSANRSANSKSLTILYAPTHRMMGLEDYEFQNIPGYPQFVDWANDSGHRFLLRLHPAHLSSHNFSNSIWIDASQDQLPDVSDLLPYVDVLITDYSSIMYDFAAFKDQIGLLAPDRREYASSDQGFYEEYSGSVPGPVFDDWIELTEWANSGFLADAEKLKGFRAIHGAYADLGVIERSSRIAGLPDVR